MLIFIFLQALVYKVELSMKEKSLLESKLQESITLKNELADKLKEIESKLSAQRFADLGSCNEFVYFILLTSVNLNRV